MTSTLRTLLSELDRPDLPDAAKQVVQLEIEKLLGRNAREILEMQDSKLTALNYALNLVQGRRVLKRTPDYLAAVDEMEIFLEAAIERVKNREPIYSEAICQML